MTLLNANGFKDTLKSLADSVSRMTTTKPTLSSRAWKRYKNQ